MKKMNHLSDMKVMLVLIFLAATYGLSVGQFRDGDLSTSNNFEGFDMQDDAIIENDFDGFMDNDVQGKNFVRLPTRNETTEICHSFLQNFMYYITPGFLIGSILGAVVSCLLYIPPSLC